jgi:hypothetical protein
MSTRRSATVAGTGTKPCTAPHWAKCIQSALSARSVLAAAALRAKAWAVAKLIRQGGAPALGQSLKIKADNLST